MAMTNLGRDVLTNHKHYRRSGPPIIQVPSVLYICQSYGIVAIGIGSAVICGSRVMSRPRRKMFGPLFYTTVVVAVLLTALTEVYTGFPTVYGVADVSGR